MLKKIKSIVKILAIGIVLFLGLSLVRSIYHLASSNQKIVDEEQHVLSLQKEKKELEEKLKGLQSVEFTEKEARDKLGLAKKGEIVIVLPDTETLKSLAPKFEEKTYRLPEANWKLWLNLFL